jgi:hypothetical protein
MPIVELEYGSNQPGVYGYVRLYGGEGAYFIEQVWGETSVDRTKWNRFAVDGYVRRDGLPRIQRIEDG